MDNFYLRITAVNELGASDASETRRLEKTITMSENNETTITGNIKKQSNNYDF